MTERRAAREWSELTVGLKALVAVGTVLVLCGVTGGMSGLISRDWGLALWCGLAVGFGLAALLAAKGVNDRAGSG